MLNRHDRRHANALARRELRRPGTRLAITLADWLTPSRVGPMHLNLTLSETMRSMPHPAAKLEVES